VILWQIGGFIYRGNTVVERMVASQFSHGVVSYFGYVGALITTLSLITMNGIGTTIFPKLAEAWASRDLSRLRELFAASLKFTFALCVPIIVSILAFGNTFVRVLFERGAFTPTDTEEVGSLLMLCTGTFLFICINTIPGKLLAATGTSKLAVVNAVLEVGIYVVMAFVLSNIFSYRGIAFAQIISTLCSAVFASVVLQIRFQVYGTAGLGKDLLLIALCGLFSYGVMTSYRLILASAYGQGDPSLLITILFGGIGLILYLFLIAISLKEAKLIIVIIVDKFRK
jgi:putative peptidoglycan lipid II flippase